MLKPLPGRLTSEVFENEFLGIPPAIVYGVDIPVARFEYGGREVDTLLQLRRIRFGVAGWRELTGREFRFPVNPEAGYIDGSVELNDAHNPADVTRIKFGPLDGDRLPVEMDVLVDFEYEGLQGLGKPSFTWRTTLQVDPGAMDQVAADFKK